MIHLIYAFVEQDISFKNFLNWIIIDFTYVSMKK